MSTLDFSKPLLALAPLAGYTDLPFRKLIKNLGANLTISEMISANALAFDSKKTFKMLKKASNENPYFVQLSSSKPDITRIAVEKLNNIDGIDGIDLNCGCPAPKVFNHGSGSSLLGDLPRLSNILKTIKKYSNKQYTSAKIRIGIDEKIPIEIAKIVEDSGADIIWVHGRTKKGGYKSPVDYDAIKAIKETVKIPVVANGDITDFDKANKVLKYTKSDGLMIGRGAIKTPWIFHQISNKDKFISDDFKKQIIVDHYKSMVEYYDKYGPILFRKFLHIYSKGYNNATEFRQKINKEIDPNIMQELIVEFF